MQYLNLVAGIAYRAGSLLLNRQHQTNIIEKNDFHDIGSIVTEADTESEALVYNALQAAFPTYNFCGEERGVIDRGSDFTWYVDPLDGTYNYTRGYPMWTLSIGLACKQRPVMGVIYLPALNKMYYAEEGFGAYCNERKIRVSATGYEQGCYSAPIYKYQNTIQAADRLMETAYATKIHLCTTFDMGFLAEGKTELIVCGCFGPWDACAGACLIREAGGAVVNEQGEEWIMSSNYFIGSNKITDELLLAVNKSEMGTTDRRHLIPELLRANNGYTDSAKT